MAAQPDTVVAKQEAGLERFVSGYRPLPGVFDEMMDADGRLHAHWRPLLSMLAALGGDEINRRCAAADRYLRNSGVFYRVYEDAAGIERPWPLSHVPLIIDPTLNLGKPRNCRITSATRWMRTVSTVPTG